jgi:nucleotide-binding universal stress UspA family protein
MSDQAVQYIVDQFGASLEQVTVVGVLPIEQAEGVAQKEGSLRKTHLEEEIERYLGRAGSTLREAGIQYRSVVRFGEPGEEIISLARETESDLIVMGRRGRGRAAKLLLGSVSDKVAKEALCPVTLIG